ncbi:MAG: hypothetical protein BRC30_03265 [Nanohaloarchaea archaeon SW_7_46_7]|nr:MAG: hypothetical protein BRC30_03265 [Nanohaloarchaea archaeon SW_7_46_7]
MLSVLGHVDSGKTTLLDNIRESKIVEGESGGITQMIGATEVPLTTVEEVCGLLLNQLETDLEIPGLMFIDTPGHAAFSSLRKRGGSISDIAILIVDIEEGVQPQTEEAIKILKESGTPFVIALNKIDKLSGWKQTGEMFTQAIQEQPQRVQEKIDEEIYKLMGELDEYDIMTDRFDRVDNFQKKAALVPISAMTGVGIPELLMVVTGLSQNYLADELEINKEIGRGNNNRRNPLRRSHEEKKQPCLRNSGRSKNNRNPCTSRAKASTGNPSRQTVRRSRRSSSCIRSQDLR